MPWPKSKGKYVHTLTLVFEEAGDEDLFRSVYLDGGGDQTMGFYPETQRVKGKEVWTGPGNTFLLKKDREIYNEDY